MRQNVLKNRFSFTKSEERVPSDSGVSIKLPFLAAILGVGHVIIWYTDKIMAIFEDCITVQMQIGRIYAQFT